MIINPYSFTAPSPPTDPILALGPVLYIKPGDNASFLNASAVPASDGEAVATMLDSSGYSHHVGQSTGSWRGIWDDNALPNGQGAVTFDGVNSFYESDFNLTNGATFVAVIKLTGVSNFQRIISASQPGVPDYDSAQSICAILTKGGTYEVGSFQQSNGGWVVTSPSTWCVFVTRYTSGSGVKYWYNLASSVVSYSNGALNTSKTLIGWGQGAGGDDRLHGQLAAPVVFDRPLSDAEVEVVINQLASETGIDVTP